MGIIRYVAKTKKSQSATIQLFCHVKPGASQAREGVAAVTSDAIELCVSAQAKDGEANKAVTVLLSRALGVAKSDVQITHGLKSRDKTISVTGALAQGDESSCITRVRDLLEKAAGND